MRKIIPIDTNYEFMDKRKIMMLLSVIFIFFSIVLISFKGLNLGIDFRGGTLIEIKTNNSNIAELRKILNPEFNDVSLQEFGDSNTIIIRLQNDSNSESMTTINQVKILIADKNAVLTLSKGG